MKKKSPSITIIGAGNVAYHLGTAFSKQGIPVKQVFSRNKKKAISFANTIGAEGVSTFTQIQAQQDLYILAVSDDAIHQVSESLAKITGKDVLVVHTSGAIPSTVLQSSFRRFGVFYPLQSFSKSKPVDWSTVPFCIDARYKKDKTTLSRLAKTLSNQVYFIDDQQRAQLHLAAVFVNNFTNYCLHIAQKITTAHNLDFDILLPLLQQTVDKIKAQPKGQKTPGSLQTGPAIREDIETIQKHMTQLKNQFPEYLDLYEKLTNGIRQLNN